MAYDKNHQAGAAAAAGRSAYEAKVGVEAVVRSGGKNPQLKGVVHEILYRDSLTMAPKNLASGAKGTLSKSVTAVRDDVLLKQGGSVALALLGGWAYALLPGGAAMALGRNLHPAVIPAVFCLLTAVLCALLYAWLKNRGAAVGPAAARRADGAARRRRGRRRRPRHRQRRPRRRFQAAQRAA